MNGKFLLDSSVIVSALRGDQAVHRQLRQMRAYVPVVVLAELYAGALKAAHISKQLAVVNDFIATTILLPCDRETAWHYATLSDHLYAHGRPIPTNDMWIAAVAIQHGLTLITCDRHFTQLPKLACELW